MIDSLLKVVEKGIELVNIKQKNNKEYFQFIVSPLFDEFEKVASEYFKLFNGRGIDEDEALSIRHGYLQSRMKVTELAKKFASESSDAELVNFFNSISEFFYGNFVVPEVPSRSNGRYYIDILTGEKTFSNLRKKPHSLEEMQDNLEQRWQMVVKEYGSLKLKYGTPIGYKA